MWQKFYFWRSQIKEWFYQDYFLTSFFLLSLFFNSILWLIVILKARGKVIPFYKPVISGLRYLVPPGKEIYSLPLIAFLIFLINSLLAFQFLKREKFLSQLSLGAALFIQLLVLATLIFYLIA